MFGFHAYFDILYNLDGRVVSSRRRLRFTRKEIAWYPFLLEADRIPGLLNVGTWKFPTSLPGIEHETFRLVAQCINQLRHSPARLPPSSPPQTPPPPKWNRNTSNNTKETLSWEEIFRDVRHVKAHYCVRYSQLLDSILSRLDPTQTSTRVYF